MPELPEVDTIRSQLSEYLPLVVKNIQKGENLDNLRPKGPRVLKDLEVATIVKIERIGKVLLFHLSNKKILWSQLGMSGSWQISSEPIYEKHTHLQIEGRQKSGKTTFLAYIDPRRFGSLDLYTQDEVDKKLSNLGKDVSTRAFTGKYLFDLSIRFPEKILKPFLLDQKYFAGIGNYMASEICARAFLLPNRKMKSLTRKNCNDLVQATKGLLKETLKNQGVTFQGGYKDANGEKGEGVKNLVVFYQKTCGLCKTHPITKITLQGRGTYYCPSCQK